MDLGLCVSTLFQVKLNQVDYLFVFFHLQKRPNKIALKITQFTKLKLISRSTTTVR